MGRQGDTATGRRGDGEKGRHGLNVARIFLTMSPRLPSPRLPIAPSPRPASREVIV
jgi:hypothetical protein